MLVCSFRTAPCRGFTPQKRSGSSSLGLARGFHDGSRRERVEAVSFQVGEGPRLQVYSCSASESKFFEDSAADEIIRTFGRGLMRYPG